MIVFQHGLEVRARVDDPASKRFPIIEDLRAEGVTDYIALPLLFIDGTFTRRAGPRNSRAGSPMNSWRRCGAW